MTSPSFYTSPQLPNFCAPTPSYWSHQFSSSDVCPGPERIRVLGQLFAPIYKRISVAKGQYLPPAPPMFKYGLDTIPLDEVALHRRIIDYSDVDGERDKYIAAARQMYATQSAGREDTAILNPYGDQNTSPEPQEVRIPAFQINSGNNDVASRNLAYVVSCMLGMEVATSFEPFDPPRASKQDHSPCVGHHSDLNKLEGVPGHMGIVTHGPRLQGFPESVFDDVPTYTVGVSTALRDDENDEFYRPQSSREQEIPKPIGLRANSNSDDTPSMNQLWTYAEDELFGRAEVEQCLEFIRSRL
ncbi:hypothetical protein BDY19DRAFT_468451 [Irpex rosettiformis]|uniref:Uncharacterized protein n=1 Tax=Irpex rosettiformis TaxID=378272 RepID=A0ACB8TSD4_9APHY|nr:hypothetical protein BDY19DRAFT_468451 [Irpex rosettiformis]